MKKTRGSMGRPYVGHAGKTTLQMNSGFVATYARSGFMGTV